MLAGDAMLYFQGDLGADGGALAFISLFIHQKPDGVQTLGFHRVGAALWDLLVKLWIKS